ncbi:hypothetical protein FisN_4Lh208 [Fistulifera solaris]|uniref:Uncharacterized protein n=1 Tax=Fistulifera solaris TaxID=1519565 RepID=A0A1Z5JYX5_FISSO|nr:hypothetical protein FisN_4Lh208 [Fistulifera solaris]|eukprot:GAX19207.1 hypothetical protein FisN_4Lh208 [Fistulifera solaris]
MKRHWNSSGIQGLIVNELENIDDEIPTEFRIFSSTATPRDIERNRRFSRVVPFQQLENRGEMVFENQSITFALDDECFAEEPIMIATDLARIIDEETTAQDETIIWLSQTPSVDTDQVLSLCEELMYLDLPGSPVKARLLVNATEEEVVEEVMLLGVNKFVVSQEEQINFVKHITERQGKTFVE